MAFRVRRAAEASLVVFAMLAALLALPATSAQAWCNGDGNPYWWSVGWAEETVQNLGTCDSDDEYRGRLTDADEDGHNVHYYQKDDWASSNSSYIREASTGSTTTFAFIRTDNDAVWKVCKGWGAGQVCAQPHVSFGF